MSRIVFYVLLFPVFNLGHFFMACDQHLIGLAFTVRVHLRKSLTMLISFWQSSGLLVISVRSSAWALADD